MLTLTLTSISQQPYLRVWQDSHCLCRALDVRAVSPHHAELHLRYVLLKKHHREWSLPGSTSLAPAPDLLLWSDQQVIRTHPSTRPGTLTHLLPQLLKGRVYQIRSSENWDAHVHLNTLTSEIVRHGTYLPQGWSDSQSLLPHCMYLRTQDAQELQDEAEQGRSSGAIACQPSFWKI